MSFQLATVCPSLTTESSEWQLYFSWIERLKRQLWGRKVKSYWVRLANIHLVKWCNANLLPCLSSLSDLLQSKRTEWINSSHITSDSLHHLPLFFTQCFAGPYDCLSNNDNFFFFFFLPPADVVQLPRLILKALYVCLNTWIFIYFVF